MTDSTNDWLDAILHDFAVTESLNETQLADKLKRKVITADEFDDRLVESYRENKAQAKQSIEQKHQQDLIEARIDELGLALEAGHGKDWSAQMAGTCGHVGKRYMELQAQAHKEAKDKP